LQENFLTLIADERTFRRASPVARAPSRFPLANALSCQPHFQYRLLKEFPHDHSKNLEEIAKL
jgi:hypothetical protein